MTCLEQKSNMENFIKQGEIISKQELHIPEDGLCIPTYIDGPKFDKWMCDIRIFSSRYLSEHILYNKIQYICDKYKRITSPYDDMITYLKAILDDNEYWLEKAKSSTQKQSIKLSKDTEKLLLVLLEIQEKYDEICLVDDDRRLSKIENYKQVLERLNSEGYFESFRYNIIGEYFIKLSEKALIYKSNNELSKESEANLQKETNINIYGNVNNSNFSTGDNSNQSLSTDNEKAIINKENWFKKYGIPIIVGLISALGTIIAAIISK